MKSNFITKYYDFHIMRLIMVLYRKKSSLFYIHSIAGREEHEIKTFFFNTKKSHIGVIWKMFQEQPEAAARFNCNFMKNFNFLHGKTFEWVARKDERMKRNLLNWKWKWSSFFLLLSLRLLSLFIQHKN